MSVLVSINLFGLIFDSENSEITLYVIERLWAKQHYFPKQSNSVL